MDLTDRPVRRHSFGQSRRLTFVDRFGIWLSTRRIRKEVGSFRGKRLADAGCGYHAGFSRALLDEVGSLTLIDVSLAPDLKADERIKAIEGTLPEALGELKDASLDVIVCNSVLEHLDQPGKAVEEFHRLLAPGGVALLNVPSWAGKIFLEFSAYKLHLSPAEEIDDHKTYYDPNDLWPLLVKAGFRAREIKCFRHKFGLNTFASCRKQA